MEEEIIVSGNGVLEGEVRVSGAKNSALKLIAAAILGRGKTVLHNVPRISDIEIMSEVLAHLGAEDERGADHSLSGDIRGSLQTRLEDAREHFRPRAAHRALR